MNAFHSDLSPEMLRDLVRACQRGEEKAFHQLFELYRRPVYRLAFRFTGNVEDAQDLTQEIFIRVFRSLRQFRFESSFSTWLYRIAVNACQNHHRGKRPMEIFESVEQELPARDSNPARSCVQRELGEHIQQAVVELPENLRSVFVLVAMEGFSYREVSEILGIRVEAVRMRMSRARAKLRNHVAPYLNEGLPKHSEQKGD